jgi:hypothetical protein
LEYVRNLYKVSAEKARGNFDRQYQDFGIAIAQSA